MRYQLITLRYQSDNSIVLVARDEEGHKKYITVKGFEPYMYVPEGEQIPSSSMVVRTEYGYRSIFGEPLMRIYTSEPSDVAKLRESFKRTYEADIPFVRRFLIDSGVTGGFEIPDGRFSVFWKDVKPVNVSFPLIVVTFDQEVESKRRFPLPENPTDRILAVSLHDTKSNKYVTVVLDSVDEREWWSDDHLVVRCTTEVGVLEKVVSYLKRVEPDVIRGWNIFWDLDYFRARARRLKVDASVIDDCAHFDLLEGYKRVFHKASNHLKDVALEEGVADSVITEGYKLYEDNRDLFIEYSMKDVKYPLLIDEKHRLLPYYHQFKTFVGLEKFSSAMQHGTKIDVVMLRDAHEHGEVLPTKPTVEYEAPYEDEESYKGAIVFEPKTGILRGVGVFDMSRFYPSIVLAWKLSPERNDGNGIYQRVIKKFFELRDNYDKQLDAVMRSYGVHSDAYQTIKGERQVVKDLLNAVYGYAGWEGSRLYSKELAASVTAHAREALLFVRSEIEKLGYGVIYGDTDSVFVQAPFDLCKTIEEKLNVSLASFCSSLGIAPILRIKFERYYDTVVFTELKSSGRGAMKRYCARCVYDSEKVVDYTVIKGYDRRDTSIVGLRIMKSIIDLILRDNVQAIRDLLSQEVTKIREGRYSLTEIALTSTLHQELDSYKTKSPFVRGSLYANKWLGADIQGGDTVRLLPVRKIPGLPPTDYVCFIDESQIPQGTEIAIDELLRMTVQNKIEPFLKVCGYNWIEFSGQKTLLSAFGDSA